MESKYIKLKECCSKIGSGATPTGGSSVYIDEGISLIRSQNVYNLQFEYNGLAHIVESAAEKLKGVTIKKDDVLLNITGDSVARSCVVPDNVIPARVNQHVSIIRPDQRKLNSRFLNYYLVSPQMQSYMLALASGKGASRKAITKEMIGEFSVPVPSIEEQNRIVDILSRYEQAIENNNKRVEILEKMAEDLYKEWFVRFRFPGHEVVEFDCEKPSGWIFGDREQTLKPKNWHYGELKELGVFKRGKNITSDKMIDGDIPVISAGISPSGMHNEANVFGKSLTISASGANAGYLLYHLNDIWAADCSFYQNEQNVWFVYNSLKFMQPVLSNLQAGAAQPHVYPKHVNRISVIIPSQEWIKEYCDAVNPIYEQIFVLKQKKLNLIKQRDLLLPRLMSGKLKI